MAKLIVGVSVNFHGVGGDFAHLIAYYITCILESDDVCALGYGRIKFGSLDEIIIRDHLGCFVEDKRMHYMVCGLCLERDKAKKKRSKVLARCNDKKYKAIEIAVGHGSLKWATSAPTDAIFVLCNFFLGIKGTCPKVSLIYCELYKGSNRIRK